MLDTVPGPHSDRACKLHSQVGASVTGSASVPGEKSTARLLVHSDPAAALALQYMLAGHTSEPHVHLAAFTTELIMFEQAPQFRRISIGNVSNIDANAGCNARPAL